MDATYYNKTGYKGNENRKICMKNKSGLIFDKEKFINISNKTQGLGFCAIL